jgi:hypothetical protein
VVAKSRAKPALPPVVVIREGEPSSAQRAAWSRFWSLVLMKKNEAPAPGGEPGRGDAGETDGGRTPAKE